VKIPLPSVAARIALVYAVAGSLWILLSDRVLLGVSADVGSLSELQTFKGWLFVALSSVLIYFAVGVHLWSRKRAEERLRQFSKAVEQSPASIVITDPTGRIEYVNPKFTEVSGYAREEAGGQNPRLLKSGNTPADIYANLWRTITAGHDWHGEFQNRRKNGELYWETASISPITDDEGRITHFIAVKEDITDRKYHEEELSAIVSVSAALRTAQTRSEMLPVVLDQLMSLLRADGGLIALRDQASGESVVAVSRGTLEKDPDLRLPPGQGLSGRVMQTGEPEFGEEASAMPLAVQGQMIGALEVVHASLLGEGAKRVFSAVANIAGNAVHRATLHERTRRNLDRIAALHRIDLAISSTSSDLVHTLDILVRQAMAQLETDAAVILLVDPDGTLSVAASAGFRAGALTGLRLTSGEGAAGRATRERRTIDMRDPSAASLPAVPIGGETWPVELAVPLISRGQVKGVLQVFRRMAVRTDPDWLNFLDMLAGQAAIAVESAGLIRDLQRSNEELIQAYDATIEGWSRALDLRDKETEGHTQRVTEMTLRLARIFGLPEDSLVHIRRGALLHDIGKMGIPDAILLKPDSLTDEERRIVMMHPQYARDMLFPIAYLRPALDIPYSHHEKWDGTGYPLGLRAEAIPIAARLFAIVDVWDALRSDRPYRRAWEEDKVVEHIRSLSGAHFDPQVVVRFLEMIGRS
jgi:PAS domain S-box-containing protein